MNIAAVLLAAGASTRMRGLDKLTEEVRGIPLLRDRANMLSQTQVDMLIVVLPNDGVERIEALQDVEYQRVINSMATSGMASSITSALSAIGPVIEAALIMPADMPDLTSDDINALIMAHKKAPDQIIRATDASGNAGSPVIFPRKFFAALSALRDDESGRSVLKANLNSIQYIPLPDTHATLDLDTPAAWAAWRATQT